MAKLSAHGKEIGRISFGHFAKAYMSDGNVLENRGQGWKLRSKYTTEECNQRYLSQRQKTDEYLKTHPATAEYRKAIMDLAGLGKAWKLKTAMDLLGNDIDGIWSECCDGYSDNISASVEEIRDMVFIYNAMKNEVRQDKQKNAEQLKIEQADTEFQNFHFGDGVTVVGDNEWDTNEKDDFTKIVYIQWDDDPAEAYSHRLSFHARFKNDAIEEVYALDVKTGNYVGFRGKAASQESAPIDTPTN